MAAMSNEITLFYDILNTGKAPLSLVSISITKTNKYIIVFGLLEKKTDVLGPNSPAAIPSFVILMVSCRLCERKNDKLKLNCLKIY